MNREIYFEFTQVGMMMRVCAVDALTGIEVVVAAGASTPQAYLEKLAVQKLQFMLKKKGINC